METQNTPNNIKIYNNSLLWKQNKVKMLEILKKSPVAGVYKNQSPKSWNTFFQFYIDFLNSQVGPRGQCAKKIRKQLLQHKQQVDQVLVPYKLNHKMHIRSLYVKFKFFIPCQQYHSYQTLIETLQKCQESISRLKQPQHPMYKSIMDGMLKKHGTQYPYKQQILKLEQNYEIKIQKLKNQKLMYEDTLSQMKQYNDWVKMKKIMSKWYDQWIEADSGIGKDSCNRGQLFENKVLQQALPYIIQKQRNGVLSHLTDQSLFTQTAIQLLLLRASLPTTNKKDKTLPLHIFLNMKWNPRSLGQIDIAIVEYQQKKQMYQALVLIECKARLFDIRQASYQVFPKYLKNQKKIQLSGKYGPVYVSDKMVSYIVTTLPDFEFILPIESNLKATLDRFTKDKAIQSVQQQQMKQILFGECANRFENEQSPLDWFIGNDSDNIIILSPSVPLFSQEKLKEQ